MSEEPRIKIICLSGFSPAQKESLEHQAKTIGFTVESNLTNNVDILVCSHVTEKCRVARQRGMYDLCHVFYPNLSE
jgi:hypothetical protein